MIRNLLIAIGICIAVAFCIYLLHPISFVSTASASEYRHCWDLDGCPRHYRRHGVRYYASPDRDLDYRHEEDRDRGVCKDEQVSVVSTEHNTEDAAKESARKLWMVQVSWKYGGRFIDLTYAADYKERCGPSNPMDTITGRLIEGAEKLAGQEGQNMRCEIRARPCSPPLESMDEHKGDHQ